MSVVKGRVATDQMMRNIIIQAYCFLLSFFYIALFVMFFWCYYVGMITQIRTWSLCSLVHQVQQPYSRIDFCSTSTKCEWSYAVSTVHVSIVRRTLTSTDTKHVSIFSDHIYFHREQTVSPKWPFSHLRTHHPVPLVHF